MSTQIDSQFLDTIIDGDKEFEKDLFKTFVDNAKIQIEKMTSALEMSDNKAWYAASHALKGSSASIGAFNFSKILEKGQRSAEGSKEEKVSILQEASSVLGVLIKEMSEKTGERY